MSSYDQQKVATRRVFLWKVPRTRSTVFQKCMTYVDGCQTWLEPYMTPFLRKNVMKFRGNKANVVFEEYWKTMNQLKASKDVRFAKMNSVDDFTYEWVQQELEKDVPGKSIIFIKEDVNCVTEEEYQFLPRSPCHHSFLIRDPTRMFFSFKKAMITDLAPDMRWEDFQLGVHDLAYNSLSCYFQQYKLWKYIKENTDTNTIIIDSDDLVRQPQIVLQKYFSRLGIPFKQSYVRWEEGRDKLYKEWRACYEHFTTVKDGNFLKRALDSERFLPPNEDPIDELMITPDIQNAVKIATPYYQEMYAEKI